MLFSPPKCLSGNFCLKALGESRHGLPSKRLSGTSFNFLIWKNESNQTHVSGQTLRRAPLCTPLRGFGLAESAKRLTQIGGVII